MVIKNDVGKPAKTKNGSASSNQQPEKRAVDGDAKKPASKKAKFKRPEIDWSKGGPMNRSHFGVSLARLAIIF